MHRRHATRLVRLGAVLLAGASLAACASIEPKYGIEGGKSASGAQGAGKQAGGYKVGQPYQVNGVWYYPKEQPNYDETGTASWYGDAFHLKATANGELFDMNGVSAAHKTLPLPSIVEVTNLDNGKKLRVRVNDRGPFIGDRLIDMSYEAARQLGFERKGLARVRVRYVGPAPVKGSDPFLTYAKADAARRSPVTPAPAMPPSRTETAASADRFKVAQTVAPPAAVSAQALPPLAHAPLIGAALPDLRGPSSTAEASAPLAATAEAEPALRVQAGAFSSQANAERAVAQLAGAGEAFIAPLDRGGGVTLYRVMLRAPADEAEAYALRDKVAEIGFADARVIHSF